MKHEACLQYLQCQSCAPSVAMLSIKQYEGISHLPVLQNRYLSIQPIYKPTRSSICHGLKMRRWILASHCVHSTNIVLNLQLPVHTILPEDMARRPQQALLLG